MDTKLHRCVVLSLLFIVLITTLSMKSITLNEAFRMEKKITFIDKEFQQKINREIDSTSVNRFMNQLGWLESRNRYHVRNGSYLGKYQIGPLAMKDVNISISNYQFLQSPEVQERTMIKFLFQNKFYLQRYIDRYSGKIFNGIYITEAGILAGAHLGGATSVKRYFDSGGEYVFRDGNGTPIEKYIEHFEEHTLFTLDGKTETSVRKLLTHEYSFGSGIKKNS